MFTEDVYLAQTFGCAAEIEGRRLHLFLEYLHCFAEMPHADGFYSFITQAV